MQSILQHTYFPSIASFIILVKSEKVWFEVFDNYEKQTYRNRCYIYGANGKQALSIPVHYTQKNRQLSRDVQISYVTSWQANHRKSIESAYRSSPFFEYYENDISSLFNKKIKYLIDYNRMCLEVICDCLDLSFDSEDTLAFQKFPLKIMDFRPLVQVKNKIQEQENYTQVFSLKHGFINNLSILDLLFNEGPNSLNYLKNQSIPEFLQGENKP